MVEQIACFQEIGYMCTLEAKKEGCGDYSFQSLEKAMGILAVGCDRLLWIDACTDGNTVSSGVFWEVEWKSKAQLVKAG